MSISQDFDLGRHSSHFTSPTVSSATPETEFRVVVIHRGSEYQVSHRNTGLKTHNATLVLSHHDMCLCLPDYNFTWAHHSHPSHHQVLLPKVQSSLLLPLSHHALIASCQESCKSFQLPLPHPPKHILSTACRTPST